MGKINLLIANANNTFTDGEVLIFQQAARAAENFISDNFEFNYSVDIVVTTPFHLMDTIPEDGISGRTYTSRFIIIVIDKQQIKPTEDIIFETICHEMSHSLRWEKVPEYANTLFKSLILEGLAITLEEKAMIETKRQHKQYFLKTMQTTDQTLIDDILLQLKSQFDNEHYDYNKIFYIGDDNLPRWAGYRLGRHLVRKYLETTNNRVEQATLTSYDDFEKAIKI